MQSPLQGCAGVWSGGGAEPSRASGNVPERRVRARGATAGGVALVYLLPQTPPVRVPLAAPSEPQPLRLFRPCAPGSDRASERAGGRTSTRPQPPGGSPQTRPDPSLGGDCCSPRPPPSPAAAVRPSARSSPPPAVASSFPASPPFLPLLLALLPTHSPAPAERRPPASFPLGACMHTWGAPSGPFPPLPPRAQG